MGRYKKEDVTRFKVRVNYSNGIGSLKMTIPSKIAQKLKLKDKNTIELFLMEDHFICYKAE